MADVRKNQPRIGRVLMARGRGAADVAITKDKGCLASDFQLDS
jgi:hypothetical protein